MELQKTTREIISDHLTVGVFATADLSVAFGFIAGTLSFYLVNNGDSLKW